MRFTIYATAVAALGSSLFKTSDASNATEASAARCVCYPLSSSLFLAEALFFSLLLTVVTVPSARVRLHKADIFGDRPRESVSAVHCVIFLRPRPDIADMYRRAKIRAGCFQDSWPAFKELMRICYS